MEQHIEVPADWEHIATLMAFSDTAERELPITEDQCYILRLVIEEIATNIVKYGYDDANRGTIQLACRMVESKLTITIRDHGRPFDPRDQSDPDLSDDLETRSAGGLGIFFVREYADTIDYHHDSATGWNELVVIKGQ